MDAELRDLIGTALEETGTPGCGVGLAVGEQTWVAGFGHANVETETAFTPATRIPIASMTKPYTATAVLALVEAGRIELDAPVRRYLPEFRVADAEASASVTVRHLLQHTAGWAGDRANMKDLDADRGTDALAVSVAAFADAPQSSAPGQLWSYSNSAFMVAGRVIEAVCAMPFETAVERLVLQPLGLTESTFFVERAVTHPLAVGHASVADGGFEVIRWPWACDRATNPSGGLLSTVGDQLTWARSWAGDPRVADTLPLRPQTREAMLTPTISAGCMGDAMGLGWIIDVVDGRRIGHHGGSLWGIQTESLFVPEIGLALVVLTNALGGLGAQRRVREHVLERYAGIDVRHPRPGAGDEQRLAEYAGSYHRPAIGGDGELLQVSVVAGELVVDVPGEQGRAPGQAIPMRLFRADEAVIVDGPMEGLRAEFVRDGEGRIRSMRFGGRIALAVEEPGASASASTSATTGGTT